MDDDSEDVNSEYYAQESLLTSAALEFDSSKSSMHVRLLQEYLQTDIILEKNNIKKAIVFFGSARIPRQEKAEVELTQIKLKIKESPNDQELQNRYEKVNNLYKYSKYLHEATKLAELISSSDKEYTIFTGGGPGFMEAANKGAHNIGKPSVSLNIKLPFEEEPNRYNTPELTFIFKYFSIRKIHLLKRAKALIAFPGGFGTLDELFEALTLHQNARLESMPIILFNKYFWKKTINFDYLIEIGTIDKADLDCIYYVETAEEAWKIIKEYYRS